MKIYLVCLCVALIGTSCSTDPPKTDDQNKPTQTKGNEWDEKTPIKEDATYNDLPADMKAAVDIIEANDKVYQNTEAKLMARCKALIEIQRHLIPLIVAYNIGKPFKITGENGETAEIKVQTGFFVSRIHSIWHQKLQCYYQAATEMDPYNPRPLVPLYLKKS